MVLRASERTFFFSEAESKVVQTFADGVMIRPYVSRAPTDSFENQACFISHQVGKRNDLDSIPLWLSCRFKKKKKIVDTAVL